MTETLSIWASAKVNLTLEVLGKRADGYHDIRSVMQRISLADFVTIGLSWLEGEPTLTCSDPELSGPHNLMLKAAELLRSEFPERCEAGVSLSLHKEIPVAAGLGGGSSDGAAALRGLIQQWRLTMSGERLMELGARLGSDVPFFLLDSAAALAEGRGERLTALEPLAQRWVVLVKPEMGISAGAAYAALTPDDWSDGSRTSAWLAEVRCSGTVPAPFNVLERAALRVEPRAATARDALLEAGADHAVMSGSGSTYFALFEAESAANAVAERVKARDWRQVWVARFVTL